MSQPVARVQVNTTATVLVAAESGRNVALRRSVVVKNKHSASIFINTIAGTTAANGLEVETGASSPTFVLDRGEGLWAIAAAQTAAGAVHVSITDDVEA